MEIDFKALTDAVEQHEKERTAVFKDALQKNTDTVQKRQEGITDLLSKAYEREKESRLQELEYKVKAELEAKEKSIRDAYENEYHDGFNETPAQKDLRSFTKGLSLNPERKK